MKPKVRWGAALAALCILGLSTEGVRATPPHQINFQGRLTNANGEVPAGTPAMELRIYTQESGGQLLYRELHRAVPLGPAGVYNLAIGAGEVQSGSFDASTFSGAERYLEIWVDNEKLSPRQAFSSVAYALQSQAVSPSHDVAVNCTGGLKTEDLTPQKQYQFCALTKSSHLLGTNNRAASCFVAPTSNDLPSRWKISATCNGSANNNTGVFLCGMRCF